MPVALVIGIGNPLRGDDGIGWQVAHQVHQSVGSGVRVKTCHQLVPELAAEVCQADLVVFVDARAAEPAGFVSCEPIAPLPSPSLTFSHHFSPAALLALTQHSFGKVPKAFLVSINGTDFGYREGLSPEVAAAVPRAVALITQLLHSEGVTGTSKLYHNTSPASG